MDQITDQVPSHVDSLICWRNTIMKLRYNHVAQALCSVRRVSSVVVYNLDLTSWLAVLFAATFAQSVSFVFHSYATTRRSAQICTLQMLADNKGRGPSYCSPEGPSVRAVGLIARWAQSLAVGPSGWLISSPFLRQP